MLEKGGTKMSRLVVASLAASLILGTSLSVQASDFYQWTDENGIRHFATSLADVPEKYRNQVKLPDSPSNDGEATTKNEETPAPAPEVSPPSVDSEAVDLERFEIPYQPYEGSARRVIIPVTFNDSVTAPMALDTGSPGMVVSFELAARLGIFSRDKGTLFVEAAGIGGTAPAILTIVDSVSVEGARDSFVPTTVTAAISDAFQGLIGMDFLSNYTISIDPHEQVVVFNENPPRQDSRGGHDEGWWRKNFKEFRAVHEHWRQHARSVQGKLGARAQSFVDFQVRESERLLQRLDMYASDHAVPRHWR
jgi:hypothetical protein